jgi:hypothetical protein
MEGSDPPRTTQTDLPGPGLTTVPQPLQRKSSRLLCALHRLVSTHLQRRGLCKPSIHARSKYRDKPQHFAQKVCCFYPSQSIVQALRWQLARVKHVGRIKFARTATPDANQGFESSGDVKAGQLPNREGKWNAATSEHSFGQRLISSNPCTTCSPPHSTQILTCRDQANGLAEFVRLCDGGLIAVDRGAMWRCTFSMEIYDCSLDKMYLIHCATICLARGCLYLSIVSQRQYRPLYIQTPCFVKKIIHSIVNYTIKRPRE